MLFCLAENIGLEQEPIAMYALLSDASTPSYYAVSLTIKKQLNVPDPEDALFWAHSSGYAYKKHLVIRATINETVVTMRYGSGRGQTKEFDEFVGPEIAAIRLTIARQIRLIHHDSPYAWVEVDRANVPVHVDESRLHLMQEAIEADLTSSGQRFFVSTPEFYRGVWTEEHWLRDFSELPTAKQREIQRRYSKEVLTKIFNDVRTI